jgi:ABC-type antimicrobial peptide transport system permease subunit
MRVLGLVNNRVNLYIFDRDEFDRKINSFARRLSLNGTYQIKTTLLENINHLHPIEKFVNFIISFGILLISLTTLILIFSLIQVEIEKKTFEFAVLKSVGT